MGVPVLLQDWTHVEIATGVTIVQDERDWADLVGFQDVVGHISTQLVTGSTAPTLHLDTSPSRDNDLFASMANTGALTASFQYLPIVRHATATTPLSRWVRWRLVGKTANGTVTFRIWLTANSPAGGTILTPVTRYGRSRTRPIADGRLEPSRVRVAVRGFVRIAPRRAGTVLRCRPRSCTSPGPGSPRGLDITNTCRLLRSDRCERGLVLGSQHRWPAWRWDDAT